MADKTFNIPANGAKIPLVIDPVPYAGATLKYTAPAWITPSSGEITITGSDTGERGYYQVLTASTNTTQSSRSGTINITGKTAQDPSYQGIAEGYSSITVSQSVGATGVITSVGLDITEPYGIPFEFLADSDYGSWELSIYRKDSSGQYTIRYSTTFNGQSYMGMVADGVFYDGEQFEIAAKNNDSFWNDGEWAAVYSNTKPAASDWLDYNKVTWRWPGGWTFWPTTDAPRIRTTQDKVLYIHIGKNKF